MVTKRRLAILAAVVLAVISAVIVRVLFWHPGGPLPAGMLANPRGMDDFVASAKGLPYVDADAASLDRLFDLELSTVYNAGILGDASRSTLLGEVLPQVRELFEFFGSAPAAGDADRYLALRARHGAEVLTTQVITQQYRMMPHRAARQVTGDESITDDTPMVEVFRKAFAYRRRSSGDAGSSPAMRVLLEGGVGVAANRIGSLREDFGNLGETAMAVRSPESGNPLRCAVWTGPPGGFPGTEHGPLDTVEVGVVGMLSNDQPVVFAYQFYFHPTLRRWELHAVLILGTMGLGGDAVCMLY